MRGNRRARTAGLRQKGHLSQYLQDVRPTLLYVGEKTGKTSIWDLRAYHQNTFFILQVLFGNFKMDCGFNYLKHKQDFYN